MIEDGTCIGPAGRESEGSVFGGADKTEIQTQYNTRKT